MPGDTEAALSFDDALRELGVDAQASAEEIRRAYLRLVKTRSPERDPAGFRRARSAYEVVRATQVMRQLAAAAEAQAAAAKAPAAAEAPAEPPPGDASPPSAVAPVLEETPAAPAEAAKAANGPHRSPEQQAIIALVGRAWQIRALSDWKLMLEAIEAATRWVSGPPVPVPICLQLIVASIAEQHVEQGLALRHALGRWLEARQDSARMLSGDLAARWLLTQELCAVAPHLPAPAATALAKALIAEDLTQARDALATASVIHAGPQLDALFQQHAPNLAAALPVRTAPPVEYRRRSQRSNAWPVWASAPILLLILRLVSGVESCTTSQPDYGAFDPRQPLARLNGEPPPSPPVNDGRFKLSRSRMIQSDSDDGPASLADSAEAFAVMAGAIWLDDLAKSARALDETRRVDGCPAMQRTVRDMNEAVQKVDDPRLRSAYFTLRAAAYRECNPDSK